MRHQAKINKRLTYFAAWNRMILLILHCQLHVHRFVRGMLGCLLSLQIHPEILHVYLQLVRG